MPNNIFAFTALGSGYPEYLSINENGGLVQITVRCPATPANANGMAYLACGDCACMTLPHDQLPALIEALAAFAKAK